MSNSSLLVCMILGCIVSITAGDAEEGIKDSAQLKEFMDNHTVSHIQVKMAHLNALEDHVLERIDRIAKRMDTFDGKKDVVRLADELDSIKSNLKKLKKGLNETLIEFQGVERDNVVQNQMLQKVLRIKLEERQEHNIEAQGVKAVSYETGQLKNISGLSVEQLNKLKKIEQQVDPAVLHYDIELLGQIAMLFGASGIGGITATLLYLPPTVGYLAGGALVGPSGFALVKHYIEVETISLFGSIFLLFAHGAQYSTSSVASGKQYVLVGCLYVIIVVALAGSAANFAGWAHSQSEGIVFGAAVCISSTSPLYTFILVNHLHQRVFGKLSIAIVSIQDLYLCFILAMPELLASASLVELLTVLVRTLTIGAIVGLMTLFLRHYVVSKLLTLLVKTQRVDDSPLVLLGTVSICLTMSWITEALGLSLECGAFFAGIAFAEAENLEITLSSIQCLDHLFGSIFFACVGMIFSPLFLWENLVQISLMVVTVLAIKLGAAVSIMRFVNIPLSDAMTAGLSLSQIGEFGLIFMIKAQAMHLISRRLYLLFLATTVLFLAFSPLLHRRSTNGKRSKKDSLV